MKINTTYIIMFSLGHAIKLDTEWGRFLISYFVLL